MKKFSYQSVIRKITFTSILLMIFYFIISLYLTETFYAQNKSLYQETTKVITFSDSSPLDKILIEQLNDITVLSLILFLYWIYHIINKFHIIVVRRT